MTATTESPASDARQFLRSFMPVTQKLAYFDHAAVGPIPSSARDRIIAYASQAAEFGDFHWLDWAEVLNELRATCAKLIGARESEISLIPNTTHGISLIAEGIQWKAGDNLLIPENEFPSNSIPWKNLIRLGIEIRRVPVNADESFGPEDLAKHIDKRTRLISVSWVGYASGFRADLAGISKLAKQHGIRFFVDAIQGLGAFPLDVKELGIDFLAADGHKWMLGPEGAGFLYVREDVLEDLIPIGTGWNSLKAGSFDPASTEIRTDTSRYEGGTQCMASMHGLRASLGMILECIDRFGTHSIQDAILENVEQIAGASRAHNLQLRVPDEEQSRSGIIGITWPEKEFKSLRAARSHLMKAGIVTSVRCDRLRVSTHAYNDASEIDKLVSELNRFLNS